MKMKIFRKITAVLLCCFAFSCWGLHAQNMFAKGDKVVNLGIGLGRSYTGSSFLPIVGSFEYGIKDRLFDNKSSLGVGALIDFLGGKGGSMTTVGVRGTLHYQLIDKFDTYGAVMLGYDIYSGGGGNEFASSVSAGGRYYFTESIGAFVEVGLGVEHKIIAPIKLGVAFKF
jgi:hypothetical protein